MLQKNLEYITQKVLDGGKCESLEEALEFPRFINLETTNNCTARCVMCGIEEWRKNIKGDMSESLFVKIADEILQNKEKVQKVALFVGNEPMLDRDLAKRISYLVRPTSAGGGGGFSPIKQQGVRVSLTSNGSLLSKKRAEEILNSGLEWINFSIDGLDKRVYEKIRRGLKFEEILGNVLQFIMLRNAMESKVSIRISVIKNSAYLDTMDNIIGFWEKILDKSKGDSIKIDELNFGITNKTKDKGLKDYEYDRDEIFARANNLPCYVIWNHLVIKSDGQVALCCVDQCRNVILGNLQEKSIKEIWQDSKTLRQIRQQHLQYGRSKLNFCKDCLCWL